jgi:hypothetical protein
MAGKIAWTGQAKVDVRAIDQLNAMRILHGLGCFVATDEGDVRRLTDIDPPEFRYDTSHTKSTSMVTYGM